MHNKLYIEQWQIKENVENPGQLAFLSEQKHWTLIHLRCQAKSNLIDAVKSNAKGWNLKYFKIKQQQKWTLQHIYIKMLKALRFVCNN